MAIRHDFLDPDRFVVGAIGDVEDRTYVLQVREDARLLTMPAEPLQIEALANHMERVLEEVAELGQGIVPVPPPVRVARDLDPLDLPLERDFVVGTMAIGWDAAYHALHVELFSEAGGAPQEVDPDLPGEELARREAERSAEVCSLRVEPVLAREFVARARVVLAADLPACPFCAQPIRAEGHACPRRNGYLGRSAWQPGPHGDD